MAADIVRIHSGAFKIRRKDRLGIGLISRLDQQGRGASVLPEVQPVRCDEEKKVDVIVSTMGKNIAAQLRRPFTLPPSLFFTSRQR